MELCDDNRLVFACKKVANCAFIVRLLCVYCPSIVRELSVNCAYIVRNLQVTA